MLNVQKLSGTQKSKPKRKYSQPKASDLISMVAFCQERNIPFCENEKRFYDILKSKQQFKDWVSRWKRYCALEIVDLPEKSKEVVDVSTNNFLKALIAMAKKAKEKEEKEEEERKQREAWENYLKKKEEKKHPTHLKENVKAKT